MATIRVKRNATAGSSLLHGELATTNTDLYFGNSDSTVIRLAKASELGSYLPLAGGTMTAPVSYTDISKYWLNTATNWGLYWDTTNNTLEFHGSGTSRAEVDLDDGNLSIVGQLTLGSVTPSGTNTGVVKYNSTTQSIDFIFN